MVCGFENKVSDYIREHNLLSKDGGSVIVALSGGADSVSLLLVLNDLGYNCIAAHCNFHLRGEESNRDQKFAEELCKKYGIKLELIHFDVEKRVKETNESVEMACRSLRYDWFEVLKKKYDAQALATGHHIGDNIETMLLNIIRGTGIAGAAGISPKNAKRVSPLLCVSKSEILAYLQECGTGYVTDSTNMESEFKRNIIRNEILPQISSYFRDSEITLTKTVSNLREDNDLLQEYISSLKEKIMPDDTVDFTALISKTVHHKAVLYHILSQYGFNREQTDSIFNARNETGKIFRSGNYSACTDRGKLIVKPDTNEVHEEVYVEMTPGCKNEYFDITEVSSINIDCGPDVIYIDSKALEGDPRWTIRYWRDGDKMCPFGMKGKTKKISDIFSNAKIPSIYKKKIPLLLRNDEIIWVIGVKASDKFRITNTTERIIELRQNCNKNSQ